MRQRPFNNVARAALLALMTSVAAMVSGGCAATEPSRAEPVATSRSPADLVAGEVRALHAFFELWLRGEVPATEGVLARFSDAIDDDFTLVTTDGTLLDHDGILDWVRENHGARPRFRLWTERPRLIRELNGALIAQYEEWQTIDGATRGRVSTAIFVRDPAAPGGLRWIRVHETWLPEGAQP